MQRSSGLYVVLTGFGKKKHMHIRGAFNREYFTLLLDHLA